MQAEGLQAYAKRSEKKSGVYSFEQRDEIKFDEASEQQFQSNQIAWDFFNKQPESYRKKLIWWIISAKKEETKLNRLSQLIAHSADGKRM
ncbi:YdeI/OmpD-associated family protein [Paenibacillus sp. N1-5-1-14]|uniref:YdeI/OmpD-associated family protein n=1 Tax=Paenibacillus radicibacter TaxID=2972488 RepID=UPI00215932EF|nr:YdeI/OmpD-associated family protein [Paenibacillus radicibacter]MCR8641802.1 YdeI/OmpD-associated family protein [Paenibacillus radicibacter]